MATTPKRTISIQEIVTDIRSGMTYQELMRKYQVSPHGLNSVVQRLIQGRRIAVDALHSSIRNALSGVGPVRLTRPAVPPAQDPRYTAAIEDLNRLAERLESLFPRAEDKARDKSQLTDDLRTAAADQLPAIQEFLQAFRDEIRASIPSSEDLVHRVSEEISGQLPRRDEIFARVEQLVAEAIPTSETVTERLEQMLRKSVPSQDRIEEHVDKILMERLPAPQDISGMLAKTVSDAAPSQDTLMNRLVDEFGHRIPEPDQVAVKFDERVVDALPSRDQIFQHVEEAVKRSLPSTDEMHERLEAAIARMGLVDPIRRRVTEALAELSTLRAVGERLENSLASLSSETQAMDDAGLASGFLPADEIDLALPDIPLDEAPDMVPLGPETVAEEDLPPTERLEEDTVEIEEVFGEEAMPLDAEGQRDDVADLLKSLESRPIPDAIDGDEEIVAIDEVDEPDDFALSFDNAFGPEAVVEEDDVADTDEPLVLSELDIAPNGVEASEYEDAELEIPEIDISSQVSEEFPPHPEEDEIQLPELDISDDAIDLAVDVSEEPIDLSRADSPLDASLVTETVPSDEEPAHAEIEAREESSLLGDESEHVDVSLSLDEELESAAPSRESLAEGEDLQALLEPEPSDKTDQEVFVEEVTEILTLEEEDEEDEDDIVLEGLDELVQEMPSEKSEVKEHAAVDLASEPEETDQAARDVGLHAGSPIEGTPSDEVSDSLMLEVPDDEDLEESEHDGLPEARIKAPEEPRPSGIDEDDEEDVILTFDSEMLPKGAEDGETTDATESEPSDKERKH